MIRGIFAAGVVLCGGLVGCGADEPVVGDEPITTEAIAAIMAAHIDLEPVETHPYPALTNRTKAPFAPWPELAEGAVINYVGVPDDMVVLGDGVSISVIVRPASQTASPCEEITYACVEDSVEGHDVSVAWQDHQPEEDPGIVRIIDRRDGEDVSLLLIGPYITDDPRELELGVPIEDLAALVTDPRLSFRTSQEVVDLGAEVELAQAETGRLRAAKGTPGRAPRRALRAARSEGVAVMGRPRAGHREMVVLRHDMHLNERQIAEALGVPEGVRRLTRARQRLAADLNLTYFRDGTTP